MRPIVLQRETEGEKEKRERERKGRPSEKLKENWTVAERNQTSGIDMGQSSVLSHC